MLRHHNPTVMSKLTVFYGMEEQRYASDPFEYRRHTMMYEKRTDTPTINARLCATSYQSRMIHKTDEMNAVYTMFWV